MPVDGCFDLLGMDLLTAHIDDAAFAADKVVTIAAQFHHVAGVDESVRIEQRRRLATHITRGSTRRAQPQRTVLDLEVDIALPDANETCRKPCETVIDLKTDTGLRGGIGMTDAGMRKEGAQIVEDRLIGNFAGQPYIARGDCAYGGANEGAPPMRGRDGKMRHAAAREALEMIRDCFSGAGKNERAAAYQSTEEDLQAAIAADV